MGIIKLWVFRQQRMSGHSEAVDIQVVENYKYSQVPQKTYINVVF